MIVIFASSNLLILSPYSSCYDVCFCELALFIRQIAAVSNTTISYSCDCVSFETMGQKQVKNRIPEEVYVEGQRVLVLKI